MRKVVDPQVLLALEPLSRPRTLAMISFAPGLALLALVSPLCVQEGSHSQRALPERVSSAAVVSDHEPSPSLEADRVPTEDATHPAAISGRVLLPDGRPAVGAVVVSSAGGLSEAKEDGSYVLEVRVPPGESTLQITAVASGATGSLTAQSSVPGLVPRGTTSSEPLHLTSSSGCTPDWVPTFGGQQGVSSPVGYLAVFDDGSGAALYAGGQFSNAGGQAAMHIAKWDGSAWSPLGSGVDNNAFTLGLFDDGSGTALYAGGQFSNAGGQAAMHIAKWDGSTWSPLGSGMGIGGQPVAALAVFDDGSGEALYAAGGGFTSAGGQTAKIAKWDGNAWSPLGSGTSGSVYALVVFDDGSGTALYVGGDFTTAGGQAANHIAKWDGSTWSPLGSGMGISGHHVGALAVFDDGSGEALYAGGLFSAGGQAANNIAKWDGSAWSPLGSGVDSIVSTLGVFDDGSGEALYVGGWFSSAGGQAANRIAKWDGSAWSPLGSGMSDPVSALSVFDNGSGEALYAGGAFILSPAGDSYIARWGGCAGPVGVPYCFGDGSGAPCPCGNRGGAGQGCANSGGVGAVLAGGGTASVAADDLVLTAAQLVGNQPALLFAGHDVVSGGNGVAFGDGLRCAGVSVNRLGIKVPDAGNAAWGPGLGAVGDWSAGDTRRFQVWYRDAQASPCDSTFNLSNGYEVSFSN